MARQGGKKVADAVLKAFREGQAVPPCSIRRVLPLSQLLANPIPPGGSTALTTAKPSQEYSRIFRKNSTLNISHRAAIAALCGTAVTSFSLAYAAEDVQPNKDEVAATSSESLPKEFLMELKAALGEENVVLDGDERMSHAKPWNSYHPVKGVPGAVVYPK